MGFLSRRLKPKRRRLVPRSVDPSDDSPPAQDGNPIFFILRTVAFMAFYFIWSSLTFPRSSGWRADLRVAILTRMGWNSFSVEGNSKPTSIQQDIATLLKNDGDGLTIPGQKALKHHQRHRIPCGLIIIEDETAHVSSSTTFDDNEEHILPLATSAIVPGGDIKEVSLDSEDAVPSTLTASALRKYPRLQSYVVALPPSSSSSSVEETRKKTFKRMIPSGSFRLRMGSEESTIEVSPPLWIIEDEEDENSESGENTKADLVLGPTFWDNHQAQFDSDEVYLYPTSSSSEANDDERKGSRVMVPYLRMRSRPSFGTEDL